MPGARTSSPPRRPSPGTPPTKPDHTPVSAAVPAPLVSPAPDPAPHNTAGSGHLPGPFCPPAEVRRRCPAPPSSPRPPGRYPAGTGFAYTLSRPRRPGRPYSGCKRYPPGCTWCPCGPPHLTAPRRPPVPAHPLLRFRQPVSAYPRPPPYPPTHTAGTPSGRNRPRRVPWARTNRSPGRSPAQQPHQNSQKARRW